MEKKVILFQGDSITDVGRDKENNAHNGRGYAHLIAAHLGAYEPQKFTFYNRGISGNRVVDLYARIRKDMINLKPDYLSILIGINDVWHEYAKQNGVCAEKFEMVYGLLVEELKRDLPDLKIMILEPFVLPGRETESTEVFPDRWEYFSTQTDLRREAAKRVAQKYDLLFVPLQEMLSKAHEEVGEVGYWLSDGVHPTPAGHELIKRAWLEAFETIR